MDYAGATPRQPVNILVVDDLPQQQVVMRTILEELGENVVIDPAGQLARNGGAFPHGRGAR